LQGTATVNTVNTWCSDISGWTTEWKSVQTRVKRMAALVPVTHLDWKPEYEHIHVVKGLLIFVQK